MATVDKNFRIKNGLVVEGSTATVNGQNILAEGTSDTYIINLIGGTATEQNTPSTVVKRDGNGNFAAGTITADIIGDVTGQVSDISNHSTDSLSEGLNNLYFTNQRALDATASAYDPAGTAYGLINDSGSAATQVWSSYKTDSEITTSISDALYPNGVNAFDTYGSASTAESNANSYTDTAITNEVTARNSAIATAKSEAISDANAYTDQEVAALVAGAPALLDTLNELAAAIADNPNYATDVANLVATKADTSYVNSELSSLDTAAQGYASAAQSAAETFATGAANTAQSNAEGYADSILTQGQGYTDSAVNNLIDGTTQFTEVSVGWMTDQVASYAYAPTNSEVTAYAWNHNKGASAKFLVRMRNGIHSQLSEVLLTRDNSNNIAITEYGIVTTNGSLGDITAGMNNNDIELKVTPTHNDGTEIIVSGTLMTYGD